MSGCVGVNSKAQELIGGWVGVNGKARRIVGGWVGVNGKARPIWSATHRWKQIADSPIDGYGGSACVYHGKVHLFNDTDHYSFDGTTWTQESTLPGSTTGGAITVVYKDRIYLLNNNTSRIGFYAWDGSSWVQKSITGLSMILYGMNNACIYNGKITVVSSRYSYSGFFRRIWQYEEDNLGNGTWTNVTAAYIDGENGSFSLSCCFYEGNVEYINSGNDNQKHLLWDGTMKSRLSDIPYSFKNGYMLEFEDKIHFIGSDTYGTGSVGGNNRRKHYTWDGQQYEELGSLLANTANCPAVVYNGKIYLFGSSETNRTKNVFVYE